MDSRQDNRGAAIYAIPGHNLLDPDQTWRRPEGQAPGDWMPAYKGELEPWKNAYPLCRGAAQLRRYLGPEIYLAEVDGDVIEDEHLIHARRARLLVKTAWNDHSARLFGIDCAERVLPIYEKANPQDDRPRRGLEAARAYVSGKIDRAALATAVEDVYEAHRDACIANEDLYWGSPANDIQRQTEAGSPILMAKLAVGSALNAVGWWQSKTRLTTAELAGSAASKAVAIFVSGHNFEAAETERQWQALRLLEYL